MVGDVKEMDSLNVGCSVNPMVVLRVLSIKECT